MPRRKQYRKSMRRPKSKLADKKINTLIEKRIEEIAKKEDRKNLQYFVEARSWPANVAALSHTGVSIHQLHTDLSPVVNTSYETSMDSVDYWCLTDFGTKYKNGDLAGGGLPSDVDQDDVSFNIRQVQAFMTFYNENIEPYQVSAALVSIPNSGPSRSADPGATTGNSILYPRRNMLTRNNWKFAKQDSGIFAGSFKPGASAGLKGGLQKYRILDRKTVVVPGSGPTVGETANDSNPKKVVHLSLNKIYKNPKKVTFNVTTFNSGEDNYYMDNENIFLVIANNCANAESLIGAQVQAGCKFSLGPMTRPINRPKDPLGHA